jgi:glycosyltransferase involved in cell wall biosynthesis
MTRVLERPLNVLWLIDHVCYDGNLHGGGRLYMNLMPTFDPSRVRIHPFFLRASPEVQRLFEEARHPVINLDKAKYDATALVSVSRLCKERQIDVMHLFCYAASTFGRIVGVARQIPTVIHDFDTQVYFPYPLYLKVLDRLLAAKTAGAFAASSFCRDYMRDVRKVPGERINILYHAIPDYVLQDAAQADGARARKELGWPIDAFIFGCITKLGPERGNETLLKAFRRVVDEVPHARLALVYKPTLYHRVPKEYEHIPWIRDIHAMRASLEQQVADLKLGDHVYLVETEGSVLPHYAASDVLVAPFENERFSSVNLVEGLAYGKGFIACDIGEAREIHAQHGVGRMVPPGDADALANAMIDVAKRPQLVQQLSARARDAAGYFTVHATTERFVELYESLARKDHRQTA